MQRFLEDYPAGLAEGRYLKAELPHLPFGDRCFDLALCSHFLFLYSRQLSQEFHRQALCELARVAGEVRVFPLVDLAGGVSEHLVPLENELRSVGYAWEILPVAYEFQKGADKLLRIQAPCAKLTAER